MTANAPAFLPPNAHTRTILNLLKELSKQTPSKDEFETWHARAVVYLSSLYPEKALEDFGLYSYIHGDDFLKRKRNQDAKRASYREEAQQTLAQFIRAYEQSQMRVFIGHGHSPVWKTLVSLLEMAGLPHEEFSRVATAGYTVPERVSEMLDSSNFAFLILTGEDERADGDMVARQNVIHETGLCQARLGLKRAIVLLESGCKKFSNNDGVVHINFPENNLMAAADDIRGVLKREGLLPRS